ncbi:MAG: hypothetical protein PHN60_03025 [Candidatus Gracilibacteria bacterium]|nr:hypothetical protein [Candidatus Gracilibacteria bacterium]
MFLIKIFYALLGISMGLGILKYRKVVYGWTGRWYWAEKYLGSGGTVFVISLIGLGLIFVSVVYPFGFFDNPRQYGSDAFETNQSQTQTK